MLKKFDRKIVLEDGSEYLGYGFGDTCDRVTEIVFNTSMVGYQEIVSDPSYTYQTIVMTYPLIGNCGIADDDLSAKPAAIGGLVVREYNDFPSNFRYAKTLSETMKENHIPGIYGMDTRKLTRSIRDLGSRKVLITSVETSNEKAMEILKNTDIPKDAVSKVSCNKKWYSKTPNPKFSVVAIDCGIESGVVRSFNELGCNVTVVPWNTPADEIEQIRPDGIFISNGPGNPEDVSSVVELVKNLKGKYPIMGICLGQQIISLAYGAKVNKLKFGHRGANYPVKDVETGKVEITTQNHSYTVDMTSIDGTQLEITHKNVLDNTVAGIKCEKDRVLGVQFYPENAPGSIFDKFIKLMEGDKTNA